MERIVNDERKADRDVRKSLGNDICRFLAEIITNSDDSYRKLETESKDSEYIVSKKPIYIDISKPKLKDYHVVTIIDNAEGMDKDRLYKVFKKYGADTAGGEATGSRGLYGQGATDVMKAAVFDDNKLASVKSIKNGKLYEVVFQLDENKELEFEARESAISARDLANFRVKYRIPENGTIVMFGVPDYVKMPSKKDSLRERIEKFYMFRFLLDPAKNRDVLLTYKPENLIDYKLSSQEYLFSDDNLLDSKEFEFNNEDIVVRCKIDFYRNADKESNGTKFLVVDEKNNVYDNTMFGLENDQQAATLSGLLTINGFYNICKTRLNRKENKEAIVLDNRTGFDTKGSFYIDLVKVLYQILREAINQHGENKREIILTKNRKFSDALSKLNRYLRESLDIDGHFGGLRGVTAPQEGIRFQRPAITTTAGKGYGLKLLINSDLIKENDEITLECETFGHIEFQPKVITYQKKDITNDNLVIKEVHIDAISSTLVPLIMTAKNNERETQVAISVTGEEVFYPETGLEFHNDKITIVPASTHFGTLYFDTKIIPVGSVILLSSDALPLNEEMIETKEEHLINKDIGKIRVYFGDGVVDNDYEINAIYGELIATLKVMERESQNRKDGQNGLISDIKIEPSSKPVPYQAYRTPDQGILKIMSNNVINKVLLGDLDEMNQNNPTFNDAQKKYVSELVSNEAAKFLVKQLVENGKLSDSLDNVEAYLNKIQMEKVKIFDIFYKALSVTGKK